MSALTLLSEFLPKPIPVHEEERGQPPVESPLAGLAGIDLLLRTPHRFILEMDRLGHPADAVRMLLLATIAAASAVGAAVGTWHGGLQTLSAAIKLPAVELLTAALCAPALTALNIAIQGRSNLRQDFSLILTSLAFGTLIAAGLSPLVLLAALRHFDYFRTVVLLVSICLIGGATGLSVFLAGMRQETLEGRRIVSAVMLIVLALVGTQMTWMARPYLVMPGSPASFLRKVDGDFLPAVTQAIRSAIPETGPRMRVLR